MYVQVYVSVSFPEVKEPLLAAMMLGQSQQTFEQKHPTVIPNGFGGVSKVLRSGKRK